jgi:hypothetical protein
VPERPKRAVVLSGRRDFGGGVAIDAVIDVQNVSKSFGGLAAVKN